MYEGHTAVQVAGQILIAILFLGTGAINATTKVQQHVDRMVAMNIPNARVVLWIGFAMQFVGGFLILFDYRTDIGVALLILFTVLASAIFHRFWEVDDPLRRHFHISFLFSNCAVLGGLLLLL